MTITNTDFLANDRAGIVFQRNVGFVTIRDNYFRNSGEDQDLDMEPSGGPEDRGPYEVDIDLNLFERLQPKSAVALGAGGGVQPSRGVRFTSNTIRAVASEPPQPGGCIGVYLADQVTIANNTVIGAPGCITVSAQKVMNLRIENNHLESYVNLMDQGGRFDPRGVIDIRERVVNRGDTRIYGDRPKPPCPYFIHYPDGVTITGNKLIQHVQYAPGITVSNGDHLVLADNALIATQEIVPSGSVVSTARAIGIDLPFGVADSRSYGYYENEKREFSQWAVTGNSLLDFVDGLHLAPVKATVRLSAAALSGNVFDTHLQTPRGIFLQGPATAPQDAFITSLAVNKNRFGCGFSALLPEVLPPHAYVRPSGQTHTGNIGVTIPCQP